MIEGYNFIPYQPPHISSDKMLKKSQDFYSSMNERRSVRFFTDEEVPMEIMENIILTAGINKSFFTC